MKNKPLYFLPFLLLVLSALGFSQEKGKERRSQVIILHTNDMHSKIDNMDRLAYLADSLRKIHPIVYLVSAGDNFTGNPVVDMVSDKGYPMIDIMNQCGFNLSAVGNHEFDMGQEMLNKKFEEALFPFIAANIDASKAMMRQPKPYFLLNAGNGDSIPFLGLIQIGSDGTPDAHPMRLTNVGFTEGIMEAKKYEWLKNKYGMLVGLTHLGLDSDKKLATAMPQFDLIIGGHSHTRIDTAVLVNGVKIVQTGSYMKNIGKVTLTLLDGKISQCQYEMIPTSLVKGSNNTVKTLIEKYNNNPEFKAVVGQAESALVGFDNLGSFYTDALREQFKADFAFQNRKGLRVNTLEQGDISLKEIFQLDPFQNEVVEFSLTASEMASLICNAYNMERFLDLAVSGMSYTVTTDAQGNCVSVEMVDDQGKILNTNRTYKVVLNDYIATAYVFDHSQPGTYTGTTTEDALIGYLQKKKRVNYLNSKRTFVKDAQ